MVNERVTLAIIKKDIDFLNGNHKELKVDIKEIKQILKNSESKTRDNRELVKTNIEAIKGIDKNMAWNWRVTFGLVGLITLVIALIKVFGG